VPSRRHLALIVTLVALMITAGACATKNKPTLDAKGTTTTTKAATTTASTLPKSCTSATAAESTVATATAAGELPIYGSPDDAAPARTMTNPFLVNGDPHAPVPLTFLVKDFPPARNCQWIEVYLPVRPNGSSGWVKASTVTHVVNPWRIEADLGEFTLKVFKDGSQTDSIKIGVATANTPTPGGIYYTTELLKAPNPNGDYGPYAYGLSGYSDTLQSFNGGPGQLGIHGTNHPELLGSRVSHGCIRMSNADITRLAHELPLGTPVIVNP
jgi:lipoprotein-anchoring transpeptidase ErfK/SrfK